MVCAAIITWSWGGEGRVGKTSANGHVSVKGGGRREAGRRGVLCSQMVGQRGHWVSLYRGKEKKPKTLEIMVVLVGKHSNPIKIPERICVDRSVDRTSETTSRRCVSETIASMKKPYN